MQDQPRGRRFGEDVVRAARELDVCEVWDRLGLPQLPNRDGRVNVPSPWRDDASPSVQVGGGRNIVHDHGTGESLDAIGLVKKAQGVAFAQAVEWIQGAFGLCGSPVDHRLVKKPSAPAGRSSGARAQGRRESKWTAAQAAGYLRSGRRRLLSHQQAMETLEGYGLTRETIERAVLSVYRAGYNDCVLYADSEDAPTFVKVKTVRRNDVGKRPSHFKLGKPSLWWVLPGAGETSGRMVIVTGGEEKALLLAQELGPTWDVCTTLAGEGPDKLTAEMCAAIAARAPERVVVALDADDAGREGAAAWAARLGEAGVGDVRVVMWPEGCPAGRDVNDVWRDGGPAALVDLVAGAQQIGAHRGDGSQDAKRCKGYEAPEASARVEADRRGPGWGSAGKPARGERETFFDDKNRANHLRVSDWIAERRPHIVNVAERLWEWTGAVYEPLDVRTIHRDIKVAIGSASNRTAKSNIVDHIMDLTSYRADWWSEADVGGHYLQVTNGALSLARLALAPHDPRYRARNLLPVAYREDVGCPRWEQFLAEVLPDDPGARDLLQEWFGYLLLADTSMHKFVMLIGEGRNGKSVIVNVLQALLGRHNCSSVPLLALNQERTFPTAGLDGRLMNVCAEAEFGGVDEGWLKALVAGDTVTVERKGRDPYEMVPTARFLMTTNNPPRFTDRSLGLWSRMIPVTFRLVVPPERQDVGLADRIVGEELPGILNWALLGRERLYERGQFCLSDGMRRDLDSYRRECNPAAAWIEDHLEAEPFDHVETEEMCRLYKAWATAHGYQALSAHKLVKEVLRMFPEAYQDRWRVAFKRVRGVSGVRLSV